LSSPSIEKHTLLYNGCTIKLFQYHAQKYLIEEIAFKDDKNSRGKMPYIKKFTTLPDFRVKNT
jgi:hypothetical protein